MNIRSTIRFSTILLGLFFSSAILALNPTAIGLTQYVAKYNKVIPLEGELEGKQLKLDFDFLAHSQESKMEGEDLFKHNWKNNISRLAAFSKLAQSDFNDPNSFLAVSIGSSSTQGYHFNNGAVENFEFYLGTDDFKDAASVTAETKMILNNMLDKVESINKKTVFLNSISFASLDKSYHGETPEVDAISLTTDYANTNRLAKFFGEGRDAPTAILANALVEGLLRRVNPYEAFIHRFSPGPLSKKVKLLNKWTNTLVQSEFKEDEFGVVCDIGGGSYSAKWVEKKEFDDSKNLVETHFKKNKDDKSFDKFFVVKDGKDVEVKQEDVLKHYVKTPGQTHEALVNSMDRIIDTAKKEILAQFRKDPAKFANLKEFKVLIRQSGKLRKLYFDNVKDSDRPARVVQDMKTQG